MKSRTRATSIKPYPFPEPSPPTFQSEMRKIYDDAFDVLVERQKKYGPHNIGRHLLLGIAVRLADKLARLDRYAVEGKTEEMSDESVEDTLIDILNYAAIGLACQRGIWTREGVPALEES